MYDKKLADKLYRLDHKEELKDYFKTYYILHKDELIKKVMKRQKIKSIEYTTYHRKYRQYIKEKVMYNLKLNGCAICGYDKCNSALDFHHVNPENKKFNITLRALQFANERIFEELNKCILVCSNCHREIENIGR